MFQLTILGSGSSGNCALLTTDKARLLVDAGLSAREMRARLRAAGVDPATLDGILLTHEHGDHTRGLEVFLRKHPVPVLCGALTREMLADGLKRSPVAWRIIPQNAVFEFAGLRVASFPVPHDAAEPLGFVFHHAEGTLGFVSDAGHVTPLMVERLKEADTVFLEANYDEALLAADPKRPWGTKQRISGRHGHLSNEQAAALAGELAAASPRLERVLLGHLSRDCNRPELARETVRRALAARNRPEVEVRCACEAVAGAEHPAWPVRVRPPEPPPARRIVTVTETVLEWRQMELF